MAPADPCNPSRLATAFRSSFTGVDWVASREAVDTGALQAQESFCPSWPDSRSGMAGGRKLCEGAYADVRSGPDG